MPDLTRWVIVEYIESDPYTSGDGEEHYRTIGCQLPEFVVRQVPLYESKLDAELARPDSKEDDIITISDDHTQDKRVFNHAIRYLASGVLPYLVGSGPTCKKALDDLTRLYCFSLKMSAKRLETAVVNRIDTFNDLSLSLFLDFARSYYAEHFTHRDESDGDKDRFALLIKRKLAKFLPQIIEFKMVQEIQMQGKLGRQLVEVLADSYSNSRVVVKQEVVEIDDDDQDVVKVEPGDN